MSEARAVRSLRLRVASPCTEDWEGMTGNHLVRYCGKCEKSVYNLSELTAPEATRLVEQMEGRMCATFYTRRDGSVLTADCPVGARKVRRKRQVIAAAFGALAGLFGWAFRPAPAHVMGDVAEPRVAGGIEATPSPPETRLIGAVPAHRLTGDVAPVRELGEVARPQRPVTPPPPKLKGKIAPTRMMGGVAPPRLTGDVAAE